ncbi:MAG: DUF3078 domain-containing protein [Rikenellaceae bacterium]
MKKNLLLKTIFFVFITILYPLSSSAQFTIREEEKKDIVLKDVVGPTITTDSTNVTLNTSAYDRYLAKEARKEKNTFSLVNSLTMSQTAYENWSAGGTSFLGLSLKSVLSHTYKSEDEKFSILTTWDLKYGMATSEYENSEGYVKKKFSKNEDQILITNNINYVMSGKFYYDFNTSITTQFAKTFASVTSSDYSSRFFAPATVNIGLGLSYKKDANRIITFSPVSGNLVFVLDDSLANNGTYGDIGKKFIPDIGMNTKINWLQVLAKDKTSGETMLSYKVLAEVFYDYRTTPTLNWVNTINLKVFEYITVNFAWTLKFDSSIAPQTGCTSFWQFNDVLSVGAAYTFKNK